MLEHGPERTVRAEDAAGGYVVSEANSQQQRAQPAQVRRERAVAREHPLGLHRPTNLALVQRHHRVRQRRQCAAEHAPKRVLDAEPVEQRRGDSAQRHRGPRLPRLPERVQARPGVDTVDEGHRFLDEQPRLRKEAAHQVDGDENEGRQQCRRQYGIDCSELRKRALDEFGHGYPSSLVGLVSPLKDGALRASEGGRYPERTVL